MNLFYNLYLMAIWRDKILATGGSRVEARGTIITQQIEAMNKTKQSFLTVDQKKKMLVLGRISQWPNENIMQGLKFRLAFSVHGYEYLRGMNYPLPSYSTFMQWIQDF